MKYKLINTKKIFVRALFLSIFLFSLHAQAKIELLDRVIAIVDSGVVMESELNKRVKEIIDRLRDTETDLPPLNILEEQVLDRLIIEEIQMQIADRAGIKISDTEVNKTLLGIASQNSLSLEEFRKDIEAQGSSYKDFRNTVRKEMIIQRVQRGKVGGRVEISEQELENFINSEEGRTKLAEQYNVQQILISIPGKANKTEVEKANGQALDLLERIKEGESFSKLATTYSSGQNALEGGSLGWRTATELPSLFAKEVSILKVGETSEPIRSGAGLHLIHLAEKRGNTVKFEDQTLARHILVQTSEIRTETQTKLLIEEIAERLKVGEDFKQLARQFSEDPGSKMDGGELGWSKEGDYDPEFEKVLNKTVTGEISNPLKSSYGWHIIEVLDRRNEDVSSEEQKNRAYQIIYKRKFEQELQSTLIELRAEAYVDIKLES
ncbi:MAG TPA: molecular chaperone SurA [Gammaproteobacteria bacterium]|jgi:peptidyl-prolyl cis-trans isomerase SurA|nr:molecular chaperone SurA [Gammaproteobacteria bacterium]HIK71965.1 molecular chaperone SurA [Gammaproteobacteria bacterium]